MILYQKIFFAFIILIGISNHQLALGRRLVVRTYRTEGCGPSEENSIDSNEKTSTPKTVTTIRPSKPIETHSSPKFAPYFDVNLSETPTLSQVYEKTGQKVFTLAFVLASYEGCSPKWGGQEKLDEPRIINPIRDIQSKGGEVILATGGAAGPYIEHSCSTPDDLANAYRKALDTVQTNHLDIDIEANVNMDTLNKALLKIQKERPQMTLSFTLPVQGDDYGLTHALGIDILKSSKKAGVKVDIVNAMTMEYPTSVSNWGESVINAGKAVIKQLKEIWPEKSDVEIKKMLGLTPMIGRNFNGKRFEPSHARMLVNWANENKIGLLSFWSIGRDKACPGNGVSPTCSSISQTEYEFTKIFQGFKG